MVGMAAEVVKSFFALYFKGDLAGALELCSEDCTWTLTGSNSSGLPWLGTFTGRDNILQMLATLDRHVQMAGTSLA